jgi:hypothetical protein
MCGELVDGGGIYTLGPQPNSRVFRNYLHHQCGMYGALYHDGNSGFFNTYENVIAVSPKALWLSINTCKPPPISVYDCYVDVASFHNETMMNCACGPVPNMSRCMATNITVVPDSGGWPAAAKDIMEAAGP